jgi:multiple sugar transport system substrate-binding protein
MKALRILIKPGLLLLALCAMSSLITACSFGARDSHEVLFWTSITDDIDMAAEQQIVAAFEKQNPDLHVKIVGEPTQGTGDATALITAVRGGTPPDVYLIDRYTVSQQASIGLLTNLQPFIQKNNPDLPKQYENFAWQETQYEGGTYALPMDTDARAMYYNKDLLKQAGIDPSVFDPSNGPLTIDQVMNYSQKLAKTDSKGNYTQLGLIPWSGQAFHTTWALNFGGKFFDPKTCQIVANEPAMLQTMQDFQQWAKEMNYSKVDTYLATYQPPNAPPSQTPFLTGHLALAIDGNWNLASIQQYAPKLNYGVTYMPVENKGDKPFTWSGGFSLVMPSGAANQDGAFKFMQFMTGPDGQRIYTKVTGHLPTWTSLLNEPGLITGNQTFFANLLQYSMSRPPLPVGAQLSDALDSAQQSVLLGSATPQQALDQVEQRVNPQMQQYCPFQLDWSNTHTS